MTQEDPNKIVSSFAIILPVVFSFFTIGLFGASINYYLEIGYPRVGFYNILKLAGVPWLLYILIAFIAIKNPHRIDYLIDLIVVVMFSGVLVTIPFTIGMFALPGNSFLVPITGIVLSLFVMTARHFTKLKFYNISMIWILIWLIILLGVSYLFKGDWLF